jgi:hypothetical protein
VALRLEQKAREFADELLGLLNATICHGVPLTAVFSEQTVDQPARATIGYKITKHQLSSEHGIPITCGRKPPSGYLELSVRLTADEQNEYLMVVTSSMGYCADADLAHYLVHYDYQRNKPDDYPEAHLQICADSPAWNMTCERRGISDRALERIHFPVGGRRFRPTLEDLVEFLIVENIADAHAGWEEVVERGRENFRRHQLRAAIRNDPETAREMIGEIDAAG